jgi:hypothetical protein
VAKPSSSSTERAVRWFWARVAKGATTSPESLGLFRIVYCLNLMFLDGPYFAWIERVPRAFFEPPVLSPAYLLNTFPPAPFFTLLDIVYVLGLCLATVGFRTRVATGVMLALQLIGSNFQYSFGKIDHGIVTSAILLAMLISDWGRSLSVDALLRPRAEPSPTASLAHRRGLALFAVLLAFGMLSAGLPKLVKWVDFDLTTSGIASWYYPGRLTLGRQYLLSDFVPHLPLVVLEAGDYFAALLEVVGFAALLTSARNFRLWLATAAALHLLNTLILNIPFTSQALSYLVFVDWREILPRGARLFERLSQPRAMIVLGAVAGAGALVHVAAHVAQQGYMVLLVSGGAATYVASLYVSLPACACAAVLLFRDARRRT